MKNTKRKGFTIVELVIVVAVIAILSAILIPTFSGLVKSAKEAALQENLRNAYTEYAADAASKGDVLELNEVVFVNSQDNLFYYDLDEKKFIGVEFDEFLELPDICTAIPLSDKLYNNDYEVGRVVTQTQLFDAYDEYESNAGVNAQTINGLVFSLSYTYDNNDKVIAFIYDAGDDRFYDDEYPSDIIESYNIGTYNDFKVEFIVNAFTMNLAYDLYSEDIEWPYSAYQHWELDPNWLLSPNNSNNVNGVYFKTDYSDNLYYFTSENRDEVEETTFDYLEANVYLMGSGRYVRVEIGQYNGYTLYHYDWCGE